MDEREARFHWKNSMFFHHYALTPEEVSKILNTYTYKPREQMKNAVLEPLDIVLNGVDFQNEEISDLVIKFMTQLDLYLVSVGFVPNTELANVAAELEDAFDRYETEEDFEEFGEELDEETIELVEIETEDENVT